MSRASREKGNRAEIEVAGLIEQWWSRLEPGCQFVRTPLSGGWRSADVRSAFDAAGDLMTTAKRWPFAVEVKRREAWSLENFVYGKASPAWAWWGEACTAAAEMGKAPMLWLRRSHEPWFVVMRRPVAVRMRRPSPDVALTRPDGELWLYLAPRLLGADPAAFRRV